MPLAQFIRPPKNPSEVAKWREDVTKGLNDMRQVQIIDSSGTVWELEQNGAMPVNIQDQTSEVIDLHLSQLLTVFTLTAGTSIGDTSLTGDTDGVYTPLVGDIVCLKEDLAFYQAEILTVTPNGGANYTLALDTPLDYAYTVAGGCSVRNINLAVDGSVTPVIFNLSPANLTVGTQWDVVRVVMVFQGPGLGGASPAPTDSDFGTQAAATKGIVFRKKDGVYKNYFNVKTNGDLRAHMYDVTYTGTSRAGDYGTSCRRTFGGQSKNGVVIRLESKASNSDEFQAIVQDDLTAHTTIQFIAQGHIVTD